MSENRLITNHPGERLNRLISTVVQRNARTSMHGNVPEHHQRELRGLYAIRDAYEQGAFNARQLDNVLGALLAFAKEGAA